MIQSTKSIQNENNIINLNQKTKIEIYLLMVDLHKTNKKLQY